jgi:hypothetical protein
VLITNVTSTFRRVVNPRRFRGRLQLDRAYLMRERTDDTEFEWVDGDWLRTFQRRPAVLRDPVSKTEILYPSFGIFHHTFIKHVAEKMGLLPPPSEAEQALVLCFGDGSPIPEDFMAWCTRRRSRRACPSPGNPATSSSSAT